jgi:hypothetical protein
MSPASSAPSPTPSAPQRKGFPRIAFAAFFIVGAGIFSPEGTSHGTKTYRVSILFHYRYHDTNYTSSHYQFSSGSSSGQAGKQRIVDQYPPGRETVCFVNPADPAEAVLDRGYFGEMAYGLIGLVLALVGAVGLFAPRRRD